MWTEGPELTCAMHQCFATKVLPGSVGRWFRKHSNSVTSLRIWLLSGRQGDSVGLRESFGLVLLGILSPTLKSLEILGCEHVRPAD